MYFFVKNDRFAIIDILISIPSLEEYIKGFHYLFKKGCICFLVEIMY